MAGCNLSVRKIGKKMVKYVVKYGCLCESVILKREI